MTKVLIADDRAADRELLVTLLGYAGYELVEAIDGKQAVELACQERPDLIVTDVLMPGVDGFEFVRQLRSCSDIAATPVIFYSALYDSAEARRLGQLGGVIRFLAKPAEPQEILAQVQQALGEERSVGPISGEEFSREHARVVNAKLYAKTESLELANRRLEALVKAFSQIVWSTDSAGHAREGSPTWQAFTGQTVEEFLGRGWLQAVHADDRQQILAHWPGAACAGEVYQTQYRLRRADGVYRHMLLRAAPVLESDQTLRQWVAMSIDISEQLEQEQALARTQELHRLLVQGVHDYAIYMLDAEGFVRTWNEGAERIKGYTDQEILGQHFCIFYPEEDVRAGGPQHLLEVAARQGKYEEEGWLIRKGGRRFAAHASMTALYDEAGNLQGFARVTRDITPWKELEAELRHHADELMEANRRKDEFLAVLAHELRNPLAPIKSAADLLGLQQDQDEQLGWISETLSRQVNHMARLIDDLLDVSRITRGKITLRRERLDLRNIVCRCLDTARATAADRGQSLLHDLPEEPLLVDGDATRLEQIIGNLVGNAVKFTEQGGTIHVTAGVDGATAVVRVRDNGRGIPPQNLPRLFELFYQVDQGFSHSEGGLGIGLTMVKELTTMHGGTVEAISAGLRKGAEFCVRLPLALPASDELGKKDVCSANHRAADRRILVVDDNRDAANVLSMLLKAKGHTVHTVYSGFDALKVVQEFNPDVILLDLGLPGMDGFEVAERLRASRGGEALLLVAVTGYGRAEDAASSRSAGFDQHLTKPVDIGTLEKLLQSRQTAGASA